MPPAWYPQIRWIWAPDQHPIDYNDDSVWRSHVAVFRSAVEASLAAEGRSWETCPVSAVFSSEGYGDELARRLGVPSHVRLDQGREWLPISATQVRADPAAVWEYLPAGTRSRLALRVLVVGAESTGTTTLSRDLALALQERGGAWARTEWVPEFGRAHSMTKLALERARRSDPVGMEDVQWTDMDFLHIARNQLRMENEAAARGGPVLICDTDSWATTVWQERYQGRATSEVLAVADGLPARGLAILTDEKSVPFVQDGYRDGERVRTWMNDRFAGLLEASGVRWYRAEGGREERVRRALLEIDAILSQGWNF